MHIEPTVNYEETSYSQSYTENYYEEQYETKEKVDEKAPVAKFADLRVIGQFNKTYILAEYLDCLYIIDQHAAHEKILFEKYRNDIENKNTIIQPLLIPMVLEMSMDDYECYIENKNLFESKMREVKFKKMVKFECFCLRSGLPFFAEMHLHYIEVKDKFI